MSAENTPMLRTVFYISDGTAITSETLGRAVLSQFEQVELRHVSVPFVNSVERARSVLDTIQRTAVAEEARAIVFSSLVNPAVLEVFTRSEALILDLFAAFAQPLEQEFNTESTHTEGRYHGLSDKPGYDHRIESVHFALAHDDGGSTQRYDDAQVIMVGVSRSGKTPTSLYLAMQFGILAANYPLTEDDLDGNKLPNLLRSHRDRLFGLTIEPEQLSQIRQERRPNSRYASVSQCRTEVEDAERMFRRHAIPFVDTTATSIEEISSKVIHTMGLERRLY